MPERRAPTGVGESRAPVGVNASRARGSAPRTNPVVPRGTVGRLSAPQKVLFATWAIAVGLRAYSDVRRTKDWPCPGPLLKISALYLMLALLAEAAPSLAAWLGVGFLVAYTTRVGAGEVQRQGTFFGVPVQR